MVLALAGDSTTTSAFSPPALVAALPSAPSLSASLCRRLLLCRFDGSHLPQPKITSARRARSQATKLQIHHHGRAGADREAGAKRELTDVARNVVERSIDLGRQRIIRQRRRRRAPAVEHGEHVVGIGDGDGPPATMSASVPCESGHAPPPGGRAPASRAPCAWCPTPSAASTTTTTSASPAMTALRTGNDCRRGCAPGANCVTSAPPDATISSNMRGVALGIGDVDAGAEHGDGVPRARRSATSSAPRCDAGVDAERAARDDVDAGGGQRARRARAPPPGRGRSRRAPRRGRRRSGPGSSHPGSTAATAARPARVNRAG